MLPTPLSEFLGVLKDVLDETPSILVLGAPGAAPPGMRW